MLRTFIITIMLLSTQTMFAQYSQNIHGQNILVIEANLRPKKTKIKYCKENDKACIEEAKKNGQEVSYIKHTEKDSFHSDSSNGHADGGDSQFEINTNAEEESIVESVLEHAYDFVTEHPEAVLAAGITAVGVGVAVASGASIATIAFGTLYGVGSAVALGLGFPPTVVVGAAVAAASYQFGTGNVMSGLWSVGSYCFSGIATWASQQQQVSAEESVRKNDEEMLLIGQQNIN